MSAEKRPANAVPLVEPIAKADRTRSAILVAAEHHFALRGYEATRLEDIAADAGLKRASIFYHFRDKERLYDAVVADAFGSLAARLDAAFAEQVPISARIERASEVWVETIATRPTIARLILRHVAEADGHAGRNIFPGVERLLNTAWSLLEQGRASGELQPLHDNPFHAASAVLGATVFYVSALTRLLPRTEFDPLAREHVETHKRDTLRTVRQLLGIRAPRRRGRSVASR